MKYKPPEEYDPLNPPSWIHILDGDYPEYRVTNHSKVISLQAYRENRRKRGAVIAGIDKKRLD